MGNPKVNLSDFKDFLKTKYNGYYYKKAIFLFIIRCLFIIAQFLILNILTYPEYICVHKSIDDDDKMFWIYKNEKYKVITVKRNIQFYLRMLRIFFDFFFITCEGWVLYNFRRMKLNVGLVFFLVI